MVDVLSASMMVYGFLLVVTNRTPYSLFIHLFSYPRMNLGVTIYTIGWTISFLHVNRGSVRRKH